MNHHDGKSVTIELEFLEPALSPLRERAFRNVMQCGQSRSVQRTLCDPPIGWQSSSRPSKSKMPIFGYIAATPIHNQHDDMLQGALVVSLPLVCRQDAFQAHNAPNDAPTTPETPSPTSLCRAGLLLTPRPSFLSNLPYIYDASRRPLCPTTYLSRRLLERMECLTPPENGFVVRPRASVHLQVLVAVQTTRPCWRAGRGVIGWVSQGVA